MELDVFALIVIVLAIVGVFCAGVLTGLSERKR